MSYIIEIGTKEEFWLSDDNSITRSKDHAIPFDTVTACNIKISQLCETHPLVELRTYKIRSMETNELIRTLYSVFGFEPIASYNEHQIY